MAEATTAQKRLMVGLFAVAISITLLGIAVIWVLSA
jgi:hypothetical protein